MSSATSRGIAVVLAIVGAVAVGAWAESSWQLGVDARLIAADAAVGWSFLGAGIAVWWRGRSLATSLLLAGVGLAWFAGTRYAAVEFLHRGVLFHVLAAFPGGRLAVGRRPRSGIAARCGVIAIYAASAFAPVAAVPSVTIGVGTAFLGLAVWQGVRPTRRGRRVPAAVATTTAGFGGVVAIGGIARLVGSPLGAPLLFATEALLVALAATIAFELLVPARGLVTRLVVDLGEGDATGSVRDRLAAALHDPLLAIGFSVPGAPGAFVDEFGATVAPPVDDPGRSLSVMRVGDAETGFIARERAAPDLDASVHAIAAATELVRANSSMQAANRARVAELAASRARLVHTDDGQRRRLERLLALGPIVRLDRAAELLERIRHFRADAGPVDELLADVARARIELRDLARGLHPSTLGYDAFAQAIRELARRASVPASVHIDLAEPPPAIVATVYFVVAEALTNAAKHAGARHVSVSLVGRDGVVALEIADDGVGGAVLSPGGGLAGLRDRVEALGGVLEVRSPAGGGGTAITALLPAEAEVVPELARRRGVPDGIRHAAPPALRPSA